MEKEFAMEEGKAGDEVVLDSPEMKFGDKAIRRGFIRKVYVILSIQVSKALESPDAPAHEHPLLCPSLCALSDISLTSLQSPWPPSRSSSSTSRTTSAPTRRTWSWGTHLTSTLPTDHMTT